MYSRQNAHLEIRKGQLDGKEVLYLHNNHIGPPKCRVSPKSLVSVSSDNLPRLYYRNGTSFTSSTSTLYKTRARKAAYYTEASKGKYHRLYLTKRSYRASVLVYRDIKQLTPVSVSLKNRIVFNRDYRGNASISLIDRDGCKTRLHTREAHHKLKIRHPDFFNSKAAEILKRKRDIEDRVEMKDAAIIRKRKKQCVELKNLEVSKFQSIDTVPGYIKQNRQETNNVDLDMPGLTDIASKLDGYGVFASASQKPHDPLVEPDIENMDYDWSSFDEAMGIK